MISFSEGENCGMGGAYFVCAMPPAHVLEMEVMITDTPPVLVPVPVCRRVVQGHSARGGHADQSRRKSRGCYSKCLGI